MSEGEAKQAPSGGSDPKPESASSGPGMTSVSAPVTSAAPPEEEEEEEESEDESEILEESPCGRWQKRREEVGAGVRGWASAARRGGHRALLSPQPSVGGRERPLWAVRRPEGPPAFLPTRWRPFRTVGIEAGFAAALRKGSW